MLSRDIDLRLKEEYTHYEIGSALQSSVLASDRWRWYPIANDVLGERSASICTLYPTLRYHSIRV